MKAKPVLMLIMVAAQLWCYGRQLRAEPSKITGSWAIEISFTNGDTRSLRFDARDGGKGSFLLTDQKSRVAGDPGKPMEAKWSQGKDDSVTFSGPMEFPIGNVGRDAGILEFKGKFQTQDSIQGEFAFSPLAGDGLTKSGKFKAVRVPAG